MELNYGTNSNYITQSTRKGVDWSCPALETERVEICGKDYLILPDRQNLEALVYEGRIRSAIACSSPSSYCVNDLSQVADMNFELLSDARIQEVIHQIDDQKENPLLLEVEAPFSILAALMNPMDLYLCMEDKEQEPLLIRILHQIADASADYIRACLRAGCRFISLADPVGTMDLVGERCYENFCGESEIYLMKRCQPFLRNAILHICRKMSLSLLLANQVITFPYHSAGNEEKDILKEMADDPGILYTGMACIHNSNPNLKDSYIIKIK